jgi:hypothetical protein
MGDEFVVLPTTTTSAAATHALTDTCPASSSFTDACPAVDTWSALYFTCPMSNSTSDAASLVNLRGTTEIIEWLQGQELFNSPGPVNITIIPTSLGPRAQVIRAKHEESSQMLYMVVVAGVIIVIILMARERGKVKDHEQRDKDHEHEKYMRDKDHEHEKYMRDKDREMEKMVLAAVIETAKAGHENAGLLKETLDTVLTKRGANAAVSAVARGDVQLD